MNSRTPCDCWIAIIGKVLNLIVCSMLDSLVFNYFLFKCFRIRNTDERQNWKSKYKLAIQYLFILLLLLCDAVISVRFRWCFNCVPLCLGFFYFTINVRINVHKLKCGSHLSSHPINSVVSYINYKVTALIYLINGI